MDVSMISQNSNRTTIRAGPQSFSHYVPFTSSKCPSVRTGSASTPQPIEKDWFRLSSINPIWNCWSKSSELTYGSAFYKQKF